MTATITIPKRRVSRLSTSSGTEGYQVYQQDDDGSWFAVSKVYGHSTSAFAALGRLTQKELKNA